MSPETVIDIFRNGIYVAVILVSSIVLPGLIVGLLVAMFQAATQINEMSLSFVPKLIITFLALLLTGPTLLEILLNYTKYLIEEIPMLVG